MSAPQETGWASARNTARVEGDKLVIELDTFDTSMSAAHQKLAKWRALNMATRAIDEVRNMSQEEADMALEATFVKPSGWRKVTPPET